MIATNRAAPDLEAIELDAWEDFYRAGSSVSAAVGGLHVERVGEALLTLAPGIDVLALNRLTGFGRDERSTAALDRGLELCRRLDVSRFFVQVSPRAGAADLAHLERRGLEPYNRWVKLERGPGRPRPPHGVLAVRPAGREDAPTVARIVAGAFGWERSRPWLEAWAARPGWRVDLVTDGDEPVAAGALYVRRQAAWLAFAATVPAARGRGAQTALLARRIRRATELGCRRLVLETADDGPESPSPSCRNALRAGFRVAYRRANWLWTRG